MSHSTTSTDKQSILLHGVIAVVGCDGTGKSTLTGDLLIKLSERRPTVLRYMGLVSGEVGDKIKDLPIIGTRLESYLASKAERAQDMERKVPGPSTAIIMHLLSIWRTAHMFLLRRQAHRGKLIIVDRYPQAEIPGFHYDGPGITTEHSNNWLLRFLVKREQKLYNWMAKHKPALIIRLNVDPEIAHARKPDHDINELRSKSLIMPRLNYNGARIHDIDASVPYLQVLESAMQAIDDVIGTA
jgi:thymidylate kinase